MWRVVPEENNYITLKFEVGTAQTEAVMNTKKVMDEQQNNNEQIQEDQKQKHETNEDKIRTDRKIDIEIIKNRRTNIKSK